MGPSRNARATFGALVSGMLGLHFGPRRLNWMHWTPRSPCRPTALRPMRLILTRPTPPREQTRPRHSSSRLGGGLYVTDIAGNPRAVPESYHSSECASAGPQATAVCHTVLSLWPAIAPTTPQKQIPDPPPTAPQTPPGCTHCGSAPAPAAHMSLLSGYVLLRKTQKNPFSAVDDRLHFL